MNAQMAGPDFLPNGLEISAAGPGCEAPWQGLIESLGGGRDGESAEA